MISLRRRLLAAGLLVVLSSSSVPAQDAICEGDAACAQEAQSYALAIGRERDIELAYGALRQGCNSNEIGLSCRLLSHYVHLGHTAAPQGESADSLIQSACLVGDQIACSFVAASLSNMRRQQEWDETAERIAIEACLDGMGFVCLSLAPNLSDEQREEQIERCRAEPSPAVCALAAIAMVYQFDGDDFDEVVEFLQLGCPQDLPDPADTRASMGCLAIANLWNIAGIQDALSAVSDRDFDNQGARNYQRACEAGHHHACDIMAAYEGETEAGDAYVQRACDIEGRPLDCAIALGNTRDGLRNHGHDQRAALFATDCFWGNRRSCSQAAEMMQRETEELRTRVGDISRHVYALLDHARLLP